jgi:asparagine synthase (glutamine-hydrolysing)
MCGIVGIASVQGGLSPVLVSKMRDTLVHRGPDDAGVWLDPSLRVAFGFRRLAILDLSARGHQPMTSESGCSEIVFNGEIYNHAELRLRLREVGFQFRGGSDTEVILAAYEHWGEAFLSHLEGMFALAIYDSKREYVLLARDRAGEKPLFYAATQGRLTFGSELKALFAYPAQARRLDVAAFDQYLAFGYVPGEACMIEGVRKLAPAHALTFDVRNGTIKTWRYWSLPTRLGAGSQDLGDLTDELEQLLSKSVKRQLVADVPVGILLSGGVDSSIVTALAARESTARVRTFTIVFPGYGVFDEGPYARKVAAHFGTEHVELEAEPATVDLLPMLARQFDEPIADSSMIPTFLVSRLIRRECTVALGGDGGDELFGGYSLYQIVQAQQLLRRFLPRRIRNLVSWAARKLPVGFRGRTYAAALDMPIDAAVARSGIYFDQSTRRRLSPAVRECGRFAAEEFRRGLATMETSVIRKLTSADFGSYLPDDILVKVDRSSMLSSLEIRAPFLDRSVVEFAYGRVPDRYRGTISRRKVILRKLGERLLPRDLDLTRKRGFSIPLGAWFKGDWGKYISDVLLSSSDGLFNREVIKQMLSAQEAGLANGQRLFALTMFELWRREYDIELL